LITVRILDLFNCCNTAFKRDSTACTADNDCDNE